MRVVHEQELSSWAPLGQLLIDYVEGRSDATADVIWEDGGRLPLPASVFFRRPDEFSKAETIAVELCRGRVLDVGAGAGCHALDLQERGLDVTALDVCPRAVEVMRRRGVSAARTGDVFDDSAGQGPYDTLLLLMNGIGVVGDLAGFERFLVRADRLLAADGQMVFDSADLRLTDDLAELHRLVLRVREGRYRGETRQQIEYLGRRGAPFGWLYLDPEMLGDCARRCGWYCQVIFEEPGGTYLACLARA